MKQTENGLTRIINKYNRNRTLKRVLSILCAVTLLATILSLRMEADTLERIPTCGYEAEHAHDEACMGEDGIPVCGLEAHVHTDACYQERPDKSDGADEAIDAPVDETDRIEASPDELGAIELTGGDEPLPSDDDDSGLIVESYEPVPYFFCLSQPILLSQIINELSVGLEDIIEVTPIVNEDTAAPVVGVDALEGDWLIYALQDFDLAELAVVTERDIIILNLFDGMAVSEDIEEPTEQPDEQTLEIEERVDEQIITEPSADNEEVSKGIHIVCDLAAVEDWPLSLRALIGDEILRQGTDELAVFLPIVYDEALLSVETTEDDYLVSIIADFDETEIAVGGHTVTLLNGTAPKAYPAQTFTASTQYVDVTVVADAGAFPEGTAMAVADIEDEDTLSGIADTVAEGFVEVQRVHAVDISFRDADGNEIEPRIPIAVVMTVREIEQDEEAVVVHVNDAGEAEVVEAPASEDVETDAEASAATRVAFEADAFSVYAVVVTKKIETHVLASDGETYKIEVTYSADAGIPEGAVLDVREVTADVSYRAQVEAGLSGSQRITLARFFDIKIMSGDEEVHPAGAVEVSVTLMEAPADDTVDDADTHIIPSGAPVVCAAHFADQDAPDLLSARERDEAVTFTAESFSVWGVIFTVDFYYGNYEYHLDGEGEITLSALFERLGIEADAARAVDVVFTDPELLAVEPVEGDWRLTSLAPFDTFEALTVTMDDGSVIKIAVEDAKGTVYYNLNDDSAALLRIGNVGGTIAPSTTVTCAVSDAYQSQYNVGSVKSDDYSKSANAGWRFVGWVYQKVDFGTKLYATNQYIRPSGAEILNQMYTACLAPANQKLIIYGGYEPGGSIVSTGCRSYATKYGGNDATSYFSYSGDSAFATAVPDATHKFTGWWAHVYDEDYNITYKLVCSAHTFDPASVDADCIVVAHFAAASQVTVEYGTEEYDVDHNKDYEDQAAIRRGGGNWVSSISAESVYQDHAIGGAEAISEYTCTHSNKTAQFYGWRADTWNANTGAYDTGHIVSTDATIALNAPEQRTKYVALYLCGGKRALLQVNDPDMGDIQNSSGASMVDQLVAFKKPDTANDVFVRRAVNDASGRFRFNLVENDDTLYTIVPQPGYVLDHFEINGQTCAIPQNTGDRVSHDKTSDNVQYVKAVFVPSYAVRFTTNDASGGGFVSDYFAGTQTDCTVAVPCYARGLQVNLAHSVTPVPAEGYRFAYWVKQTGNTFETVSTMDNSTYALTTDTPLDDDATFIGVFAKGHIIPLKNSELHANGTVTPASDIYAAWGDLSVGSGIQLRFGNDNGLGTYIYSSERIDGNHDGVMDDPTTIVASEKTGYQFVGWFNGSEMISNEKSFDISHVDRDLMLTPVYAVDDGNCLVWFDGTNGLTGGLAPNNTFYARKTRDGSLQSGSSTSVLREVAANTTITLPNSATASVDGADLPAIGLPMGSDDTHFVLKGWYNLHPENTNPAQEYFPVSGNLSVTITGDTVFYADWFRSDYNVGQLTADTVAATDTSGFIRTYMFDYNNLFNMQSMTLDSSRSSINREFNYEYWVRNNLNTRDFLFITAESGVGRSVNPQGREWDTRNSDNETSISGHIYAGIVTTGILTSSLKSDLFSTSDAMGKRYLGRGSGLYTYDSATGYYYFDSDKNAASYNAANQTFYLYDYVNRTNKSTMGSDPDYTDFLPLNYGNREFSEMRGEVNYWFGMRSEIDFFLPNETGFMDANGHYGNQSSKSRDMVYKFAGDDDVWVFVDNTLVLDMGGIHGKVYGEINFSKGTWQIAQEGTAKTLDGDGIISYGTGGNLASHGTIDFKEGQHTLTLYYLERGASQSNCAIYFNLAPKYTLQFHKVNEDGTVGLADATFGIYTDPACTLAADVWGTYTGQKTNIFTTGGGTTPGYVHCSGLVAGRTYYIKELSAPTGYPDISEEVITLTIDATGVPTVSSTLDDQNWQMATVTSSEADGSANQGLFMFYLTVKNRPQVSITAKKIWSMYDGSTETRDTHTSVTVKLQRKLRTNQADAAQNVTVRLITRYFADGSNQPTNTDAGSASIRTYGVESMPVARGGSVTFDVHTGAAAGIYSVASQYGGIETQTLDDYTAEKLFYEHGGWTAAPRHGQYRLSNIQRNTDIYITCIGTAASADALCIAISGVITAQPNGTVYSLAEDTTFNGGSVASNNQPLQVTLNSQNNWQTTWSNLESGSGGNTYYYYVTEIAAHSALSDNPLIASVPAYVDTYSSDGLSGGTITVRNTLKAQKLRLVKQDEAGQPLAGAGFEIYLAAEYNAENGQPLTIAGNAAVWLDDPSCYDATNHVFVSQSDGKFYSGYLPLGTYYIVEKTAPADYKKLRGAIRIVLDEDGMLYQSPTDESPVRKKMGSDGYYALCIEDAPLVPVDITIRKVINGTSTPLPGAAFTLTKVDESNNVIMSTADPSVPLYAVTQMVGSTGEATGKTTFTGLKYGRYRLEETTLPTGYVKVEGSYYINVDEDGAHALAENTYTRIAADANAANTYIVENELGVALPSTGGPGTAPVYATGAALVLLALALLLKRRTR